MNWDDLTYLLAVRLRGVDKTTVSRRLAALEQALGQTLVERDGDRRLVLTQAGHRVAHQAEQMEDAARHIAAPDPERTRGWVRVTAVPLVVNHMLLPAVPRLTEGTPGVAVELIAEARDLSLTHHDADVALRLARPQHGGEAVLARRLGQFDYGAYAAVGASGDLPWIGYDRRMQYLSHAAALSDLAQGQSAALAVNDAETLYQAVLMGQGRSVFPRRIAGRDARLREVPVPGDLPSREVWLMVRRDVRRLDRVAAVIDWLDQIVVG